MNKILNWTFGACFRTLGRFLAIFLILALFLFIGSKLDIELPDWLAFKVNASTITSYDSTFSTSNRYYYSTSNTLQNNSLGVIGNVYSGKSYNFTFYLNTSNLVAQSTYDITINANSNDFTKNLNASSIYIKTSNSTDFTNSTNGISLISFTNTATSSKNSNKIVLRIYVNSLSSYTMIDIFNSNYLNITSVSNFGIKSLSIEEVDTSGNNEIIENDKNNTQNIINNSNQNTQDIIDNQNELLSTKCSNIFNYNLSPKENALGNFTYSIDKGIFTINGTDSNYKYISYSIELKKGTYYYGAYNSSGNAWDVGTLIQTDSNTYACNSSYCSFTINSDETITFYPFRVGGTSYTANNLIIKPFISKEIKTFCEFGSTTSKLDETNNAINDLNDNLNNSDTTGAQDSASGFFDNFSTETFGLTSIITAPLNTINSIINSSCNNLVLPLPFVNKNLTLPCMNSIYSNYFKGFFDLYQIITTGLISYYIIVRIFNLVKDFKNPDHDEIEVMDL